MGPNRPAHDAVVLGRLLLLLLDGRRGMGRSRWRHIYDSACVLCTQGAECHFRVTRPQDAERAAAGLLQGRPR